MKVVFVGGTGRSGTTLLQKILTAHSKVTGGPEFDHARRIAGLYERMALPYALERQEWFYDKTTLRRAFATLFNELLGGALNHKPGATWISEKTPANIEAAKALLEIIPDAKYVHMIRDGRDVVASHRDVYKRFQHSDPESAKKYKKEYDLYFLGRMWNHDAFTYQKLSEDRNCADRILSINYEELVADPGMVIKKLLAFLKLDIEQALLEPENIDTDSSGLAKNIDGVWYTKEGFSQPFNTRSVGRWKTSLPLVQRVFLNILMARQLEALGYSVDQKLVIARRLVERIPLRSSSTLVKN